MEARNGDEPIITHRAQQALEEAGVTWEALKRLEAEQSLGATTVKEQVST